MGFGEIAALGQGLVAIAHAVRLDVCLGCDIQSVLVAQVVPTRVVGIMAGADGIDVETLHYLYVLNHAFHAHNIASVGVKFVSVNSFYQHWLAIDQQLTTLNLDVAETNHLFHHIQSLAAALQSDEQRVQIGSLRRPRLSTFHRQRSFSRRSVHAVCGGNLPSVSVEKLHVERRTLGRCGGYVVGQATSGVAFGQVLRYLHVRKMAHRTCVEVNFACNTGETPEVLVLQIGAVAPSHHLHGNLIATRLEVFGYVKLGCHLAVFAVTNVFAVDPKHEVARCGAYMETDFIAFPTLRKVETAAIGTHIVVGFADERRIALEGSRPCVARIPVCPVAVAVYFQQSWHGKIHPLPVIEVGFVEVLRSLVVVFGEVEFPFSLHRKVAFRAVFVAL